MPDRIQELLEIFELSEILEMNDVTDYEALEILIRHGYLDLTDELPYEEQDPS